jgi:2-phospho-L-lactate guanylyltransferase
MTTVAVVPLNWRSEAKSRLRATLDDSVRETLVSWMSARVLAALRTSAVIAHIAVVSPDEAFLAEAAAAGAVALAQAEGPLPESGGLNEGLELGRRWALASGADMLLVVLGDLPLLSAAEVRAMVYMGGSGTSEPRVVLAPDRREQGTNAMLLSPPAALPFAFGAGSLVRHRALARARGADLAMFRSPGTSFDVDLPEDLEEMRRRARSRPESWLREMATRGDMR